MVFFLGVTDLTWFTFLKNSKPEEANFWQPGGNSSFKILAPGAPFLFKLKSPINAIAGLGFFSSHTFLPVSIAWDTFGQSNGCSSRDELLQMILKYRQEKTDLNPTIGCVILTNPIFFDEKDWIQTPADWSPYIVKGKSYETGIGLGRELWEKVEELMERYLYAVVPEEKSQLLLDNKESPAYGRSILTKVRLGQGAFRILVTDAYNRRCAISGERTLPVLEAAHIKPYSQSGPHFIANSLLLRSDLHKLFDFGYLTLTKELKIEVSRRIKVEFENGKDYYRYHGLPIANLPGKAENIPSPIYLDWHNQKCFKG